MKLIRLLFFIPLLLLGACGFFSMPPEIAQLLAKHYDNKMYKRLDTQRYHQVFDSVLVEQLPHLAYKQALQSYYAQTAAEVPLVSRFIAQGDLDSLVQYVSQAAVHGLNAKRYHAAELAQLLKDFQSGKFKDLEEVYPALARLELFSADALLRYTNDLEFGVMNPKTVFNRYYLPSKRADSALNQEKLHTEDMLQLLQQAQPRSAQYLALQRALQEKVLPQRILLVNMERLRWRLPEMENYVQVNIADFKLTWFKQADTLMSMRVCVGERREAAYEEKLKTYLKTKKLDDKPKNHETPMILSELNGIQVNPIWNIPVSIAQNEIYYMARKDPYYLSNNNIRVYQKDQLIEDPDTINWDNYTRDKLPFKFKQGSGDGNALGKFKFMFDNGSSIYLHDTNNKSGFARKNRALSHGCVRIEDPLGFAERLVSDDYQYDRLRVDVDLKPVDTTRMGWFKKRMERKVDTVKMFTLKPSYYKPKQNIPILLTYFTAWSNNGKIETCADVYDYDEKIWTQLKKAL